MWTDRSFVRAEWANGGGDERRAVLITGCDSGFGRALALRCAQIGGLKVYAACLTAAGCEALAAEVGQATVEQVVL